MDDTVTDADTVPVGLVVLLLAVAATIAINDAVIVTVDVLVAVDVIDADRAGEGGLETLIAEEIDELGVLVDVTVGVIVSVPVLVVVDVAVSVID